MQKTTCFAIGVTLLGASTRASNPGAPTPAIKVGKPENPRIFSGNAGTKPYLALIGASIGKGDADSVTVGEVHTSKRNPRVVRLTVQAVKEAVDSKGDGKSVSFVREFADDTKALGCSERDPAKGNNCDVGVLRSYLSQVPPQDWSFTYADLEPLKELLRGLNLDFLRFSTHPSDLAQVLQTKGVAIVSLGLTHATGYFDPVKNEVIDDCLQGRTKVEDSPYNNLPDAYQEAIYDAYAKAQRAGGRPVLVIPSDVWTARQKNFQEQGLQPPDVQGLCHAHFRAQNLLVTVVAVDDFNATVIAPRDMKPAFQKVARKYPDAITFVGEGGSGWGKPSRRLVKTEL